MIFSPDIHSSIRRPRTRPPKISSAGVTTRPQVPSTSKVSSLATLHPRRLRRHSHLLLPPLCRRFSFQVFRAVLFLSRQHLSSTTCPSRLPTRSPSLPTVVIRLLTLRPMPTTPRKSKGVIIRPLRDLITWTTVTTDMRSSGISV